MRAGRARPGDPWRLGPAVRDRWDHDIRAADFLLFAVLPWGSVAVGSVPLNEIAAAAVVALTVLRRPRTDWRVPGWFPLLLAAIVGCVLMSAALADVWDLRRIAHVGIWAGLAFVLATGRVATRSAGLGLALGVVVAALVSLTMIGSSNYSGRLTGVLADPNGAAYLLVTYGCLGLAVVTSRRMTWLIGSIALVALLLTYSRTGLLALGATVLWLGLGRRVGALAGVAFAAAAVWLVTSIPQEWRLFGPFESRAGSDDLRDRIIAAEQVRLDSAPWWGNGPGTSHVTLQGQEFFFHNCYLATRNEGGWPLLVAILLMFVTAFAVLVRQARTGGRVALPQSALVAVCVMAATLGEVFLELPAAVAIGFAVAQLSRYAGEAPEPHHRRSVGTDRPEPLDAAPAAAR